MFQQNSTKIQTMVMFKRKSRPDWLKLTSLLDSKNRNYLRTDSKATGIYFSIFSNNRVYHSKIRMK